MTQKLIKIFINENYSKPPRKSYPTNKTDVYHIDDVWSLDRIDHNHYGHENNRGCKNVLVIMDNFSKFDWRKPLKSKNAQTKGSFENVLTSSKRKPDLVETDLEIEDFTVIFFKFS